MKTEIDSDGSVVCMQRCAVCDEWFKEDELYYCYTDGGECMGKVCIWCEGQLKHDAKRNQLSTSCNSATL